MIKALLFDLYDTLASIDIDTYRATKAEMARTGGVPADPFLEAWRKYTKPSAKGDIITVEERVARVMRDLGAVPEFSVVRTIAALERDLQLESVRLHDGVAETLSYLKGQGLKLGLVTNTPAITRTVPAVLGIQDFFDTMVFSFDVATLKPDPEIYLAACRNLRVEPLECAFTGDGNDRELDGAHDLGMLTVKVGPGRAEGLRHEQSEVQDYTISCIAELSKIVEGLR